MSCQAIHCKYFPPGVGANIHESILTPASFTAKQNPAMGKTLELGRRLELNPLDIHCADISVGLYEQQVADSPHFLVHSYAKTSGADQRISFLRQALIKIAGLEPIPNADPWLRFRCKHRHPRALRRIFLDLCKLETDAMLTPKPLEAFDKKAEALLTVRTVDTGVYSVECQAGGEIGNKRAVAVARGFAKLCELPPTEDPANHVAFTCQSSHDGLMGALLYRAQNVRAAMAEEEEAAARGMLSAPSQQK